MYLPVTVEANLRPIVGSPPMIFKNCINNIRITTYYEGFKEIYDKCSKSNNSSTPTESTTVGITTTELFSEETTVANNTLEETTSNSNLDSDLPTTIDVNSDAEETTGAINP